MRGRKIGEVVSVGDRGMRILAQGGFVEVSRVRLDDGAKIKSTEAGIAGGDDPRRLAALLSARDPAAAFGKSRHIGAPPPPS